MAGRPRQREIVMTRAVEEKKKKRGERRGHEGWGWSINFQGETRGLMRWRMFHGCGIPAGLDWDWKLCQGRLRKKWMNQEEQKTRTAVHTQVGSVCRDCDSIKILFTSVH